MAQAKGASAGSGRRPAAPPVSTGSPMLGVVLVAVAALIGVMLLAKGGGAEKIVTQSSSDGGALATPGGDAGQSPTPTEPVTVVTTPAAQLKIIVANGSNVKGVAKKAKDQLAAAGYSLSTAVDASASVPNSIVYYVAGADADARAVAQAIGLSPDLVALMPTSPPIKQQLGDAKILVVLSSDSPQAGGSSTGVTTPPTSGA